MRASAVELANQLRQCFHQAASCGDAAQLGERLVRNQEAAGSIRVVSTFWPGPLAVVFPPRWSYARSLAVFGQAFVSHQCNPLSARDVG